MSNKYKYSLSRLYRTSAWVIPISILSALMWYRILFPDPQFFKYIGFYYVLYMLLWEGTRFIIQGMEKIFPRRTTLIKHLMGSVLLCIVYSYIIVLTIYYVEYKYILLKEKPVPFIATFFEALTISMLLVAIHEGNYFFSQWKIGLVRTEQLEKNHLQAKLNNEQLHRANLNARYDMLRTQINPHFFFNSLNTLSYLINNRKDMEALEMIGNISEFFKYSLITGDKEVTLLRDEMVITEKYMQLQKARFGKKLEIDIRVDEHVREQYYILPFALQILMENALKHNEISKMYPLKVEVGLCDRKEKIFVKNNINKKQVGPTTRIGLNNLKERYAYLSNSEVEISSDNQFFIVKLPLLSIKTQTDESINN